MVFFFCLIPKVSCFVADDKGQERADAAEGPLTNHTPLEDNHLAATVKFYAETDHDLTIPIFPESFSKKVKIECNLYPPYMPFGCDGPQITMSSAIDLLDRLG